jgi:uncharacterized integral membrane protein
MGWNLSGSELFTAYRDNIHKFTAYHDNRLIYLLTAIELSPGGSSTVHIYTQTIHRTTQLMQNSTITE